MKPLSKKWGIPSRISLPGSWGRNLCLLLLAGGALAPAGHVNAANDTLVTVNLSATDLSQTASYSGGVLPVNSNDVEFAVGPYTGGTTFTVNGANLNIGTLDDINTTQSLVIGNSSATTGSITLTLVDNNEVSSNIADLLYVKSGANLTIESSTGTLNLDLTKSGNIDNAGTLSVAGPINISSGDTVTFTGAGATTVDGVIAAASGVAGVAVNDAGGSVTFGAANSYTGATTINGGTLVLDFSQVGAPTATGILSSSSALTLSGGTLSIKGSGSSSVANSQTVNGTTLTAGTSSFIALNSNGSQSTSLVLGAITRGAGSTLDINLNSLSSGSVTTSTMSAANGILAANNVAYASADGGTTWATNSSGTLGALALGGYTQGGGNSANYASANNVDVNNGDSLTATTSVNTLRFNTPSTADALAISSGQTLTVGTGGILITPTTAASITGGNLTAGSGNELVFLNYGTMNIGSAIVDNGSATSVTLGGTGTTILSGANTYTGNTTLAGGTLDLHGSGLTVNNFSGSAAAVVTDSIASSTSALTIGNNNGTGGTYAGSIQNGSGTVSLIKEGTGTITLSGANTYSGGTTIQSGTLAVSSNSGLGTGTITLGAGSGSNNATLNTTFSGLTMSNAITVAAGSTGTLMINATSGNEVLGNITLNNNLTVQNGAGGVMTLGTITGTGNLTVQATTGSADWSIGAVSFAGAIIYGGSSGTYVKFNNSIASSVTGITVNDTTGDLAIGNSGIVSTMANGITMNGGTLELDSLTAAANNAVTFTGGDNGAFSFHVSETSNGAVFQVGSLAGGSTTALNLVTGTGTAFNVNLTVGGNNSSTSYSGVIQNGSVAGGSLTKVGTGTLTLSGANTYTGATTVNAGALLVVGGSLASGSAVSVAANTAGNATLGGAGTIGGTVSVGGGTGTGVSVLNSGLIGSVGTLNVGATTFGTKSELSFTLNSAAGSAGAAISLLNVNGALSLDNGVTTLVGTDLNSGTVNLTLNEVLVLASATSLGAGTFSGLANGADLTIGNVTYQINYGTLDANEITLEVESIAAVPEPSASALLGGGLMLLCLFRRRLIRAA